MAYDAIFLCYLFDYVHGFGGVIDSGYWLVSAAVWHLSAGVMVLLNLHQEGVGWVSGDQISCRYHFVHIPSRSRVMQACV